MKKLIGMRFTVIFDREVKKDFHYISPGQYGILCHDDEIAFDFNEFIANIDKVDPTKVVFEVRNLDTKNFDEASSINPTVMRESDWTEFYIYTGEKTDPELHPLKATNIVAYFQNGETVRMDDIDFEELYREDE